MKKELTIYKYVQGQEMTAVSDWLAEEKPLTIYINDLELVTLQCSPQCQAELAVGYLAAEGIISPASTLDMQVDEERGLVQIFTDTIIPLNIASLGKRTVTTGCGRGASSDHPAAFSRVLRLKDTKRFELPKLVSVMQGLQNNSQIFPADGGVHRAALQLAAADTVIVREDVGRHNAVDKILGFCILQQLDTAGAILYLSGRISSEIVVKAVRLQIPLVISRSAPTTLAGSRADV